VQTNAAAKALADTAAATANAEAPAPQANAAKEKAQMQATQVQEPTNPEVPLEGQLESTAKEVMPAVTADMAALMAMMQSMQQDNATHTYMHVSTAGTHNCRPSSRTSDGTPRYGCNPPKRQQMSKNRRAQRTPLAEVNTKITSASTELERLAKNAHQSQLLVQDLKSEMGEQVQHAADQAAARSRPSYSTQLYFSGRRAARSIYIKLQHAADQAAARSRPSCGMQQTKL
jgi:hypothetical protein